MPLNDAHFCEFSFLLSVKIMNKYVKIPTTIEKQINNLKERGLIINDVSTVEHFLSHNNYFRLRAYTYPFQNKERKFTVQITFTDILDLYNFDSKLRSLIFSALEKIEISLRTQITYNFSLEVGKDFYLYPKHFSNVLQFFKMLDSIIKEENRSKDKFVGEHLKAYSDFFMPIWKATEIMSFGNLSIMFKNLKDDKIKTTITQNYGLYDVDILENWLRGFTVLRNICCHHSRLWNRTLSKIKIPKKPKYQFTSISNNNSNKIYSYFCCTVYLLNIIKPDNTFKTDLTELMKTCPLNQSKNMGFPVDWQDDEFWKK